MLQKYSVGKERQNIIKVSLKLLVKLLRNWTWHHIATYTIQI
jgi:hypothetical protein